jgi:hypothetical protein
MVWVTQQMLSAGDIYVNRLKRYTYTFSSKQSPSQFRFPLLKTSVVVIGQTIQFQQGYIPINLCRFIVLPEQA